MNIPKTRREREIWQACDELVAAGFLPHKVTGDAIRDQLLRFGFSKGSPNEVYKYRKSWRAIQGIQEEEQEYKEYHSVSLSGSHPLPDTLNRVVNALQNAEALVVTELKNIQDQELIKEKRYQELQDKLQAKLEHIAKLEERNRQLQAIITEKYFLETR